MAESMDRIDKYFHVRSITPSAVYFIIDAIKILKIISESIGREFVFITGKRNFFNLHNKVLRIWQFQ